MENGGISEIEFMVDQRYQAVLSDWPETLSGNVQCLADGTLKLTFRQGYLIASVHLAEDRLSLSLLAAIGLPTSIQKGSWQYRRNQE